MDPFQVETISQRLIRDVYTDGAQIHMCAVAAIEIALWDIIGKACNQPIYNLVGRAVPREAARVRQRLVSRPAHAGELRGQGQTGGRARLHGSEVRSVRMRAGGIFRATISTWRWTSSGRCGTPSGPSVDLLIEAHCRFNVAPPWSSPEAIHQFRPAWFEEPVAHTNIQAMVEVARRSPVPIATGESFSTKQQFAELLKHDVVNILQPEPLNLGGLFAARKIADMVDAHYGVIAPHSAQGPVCSAACVQLNASIPNFFIHELFDEFNEPWERDIVTQRCTRWMATSKFPTGRAWGSI